MNKLVSLTVVAFALVTSCVSQESPVTVTSKGKQKWSNVEINKIYFSACNSVRREFGNSNAVRPVITLVLGADKDAVDFDRHAVLLTRWDRDLFAQGVVILAFEDLLTPQRRVIVAKRALNWADATVDVRERTK